MKTVNKLWRIIGAVIVIICLLATGNGPGAKAQRSGPWQYFPETGHSVSGVFWTFYQAVPNAALVYGLPITEQFSDSLSGREVQYFQRARFEYHPEKPPGERVLVSNLGPLVSAHTPVRASVAYQNPIGCRRFASTGFTLCYDFLKFFDRNGGEAVFGDPISAYVFYGDRIVQYFERARFDWYPEYPEGQKVVLAQLGRIYFDLVNEDANRLKPVIVENTPDDVKEIRAHAFTWKALTRSDDRQEIYVVVQDQTLQPVAGATVVISITWPQGGLQSVARTSNDAGVVSLPLDVTAQPTGNLVLVQAEVLYQGLSAQGTTSFRIWQ